MSKELMNHSESIPIDLDKCLSPEGFIWICCRKQADGTGCVRD